MNAPVADSAQETVRVALGERAYDIHIGRGVIERVGSACADLGARAVAIVTDDTVARLHADAVRETIDAAGLRTEVITVPPGEASKGWAQLARVCDAILASRIERGDLVLALGGGIVGDLAGFAAAIVRRGVRFVQAPTTLLAQVDSSVGGKTGINSVHGKNLVGAFHQPSLVLADTALLDTLPERELKAGYAEIVKYGLIDDPVFFAWCEDNGSRVIAGGPERDRAVAVSCKAKAAIVARDEREEGDRALLNLGHTFAHALERLAQYDPAILVHGEAVAAGLALAYRFSAYLGLCAEKDADRVARHLAETGLPTTLTAFPCLEPDPERLLDAMAQDKKVVAGQLTFILARRIGESFIAKGVEVGAVKAFLARECAGNGRAV